MLLLHKFLIQKSPALRVVFREQKLDAVTVTTFFFVNVLPNQPKGKNGWGDKR